MIPRFPVSDIDIKNMPEIEDVEDARRVLAALPLLAKLTASLKAKLQAWADANDGIPTDGGVWRKVETTTTCLVADAKAIDVLDHYFGSVASKLALSTEVSAASIKRAVEASGLKPVQPMVTEIVEAIKAAGSFTTSPKTAYELVKTKAVA